MFESEVNRLVYDNIKIRINQQTQVGHLVNSKNFRIFQQQLTQLHRILIA